MADVIVLILLYLSEFDILIFVFSVVFIIVFV